MAMLRRFFNVQALTAYPGPVHSLMRTHRLGSPLYDIPVTPSGALLVT